MSALSDRATTNVEARIDDDLFKEAETEQEKPSVSIHDAPIPDVTLNIIINKLRHGRSDMRIKHTVLTPAGQSPSLAQIREIRAAWAVEVSARKAAAEV